MLTKKERIEKLNNAGVNTGKYFTLNVNESIPAGAKIHIVIDKDGNYVPEVVKENDAIFNMIIEDGYVRNTKLHRRFVMAQMFHMLNSRDIFDREIGYNEYLKNYYGYDYTLKMMIEEIRVLGKLEVRDVESFNERVHFFDQKVVIEVLEDYLEKLKKYVKTLPNRNCKGVPYKRIKSRDVFVADLDKKIYAPVRAHIFSIMYAKNYAQIYDILEKFARSYIRLPYGTPKSKVWIDTYKGAGAYYTMKNLVMFHNCTIYTGPRDKITYRRFDGAEAVRYLNSKLDEYKGEGWRMFAMMKKLIADNDFDFKARMEEIYNN